MMRMRFFILLLGLMGCTATSEPGTGELTAVVTETAVLLPTPTPQEIPTDVPAAIIPNEAVVASVQVQMMESMPVQVNVTISGSLPDGCTAIASITSEQTDAAFNINITTQRDIAALCTEALVPFTETVSLDVLGLPAGTYTVNVMGRDDTLTETFTLTADNLPVDDAAPEPSDASLVELPAACVPQDDQTGPLVNVQDGYCFQYPVQAGFRIHDVLPIGVTAVWGPPLTPTFEPIRAGLTVHKREPVNGRSLEEIVAAVLEANPGAQVVDAAATFAGEPAQIVEGIDGMMDSRRYYLIHDDYHFEITLVPLTQPGEFEEAVMEQRGLLWQTVSSSFTWLPPEIITQFSSCPSMDPAGPTPNSLYVNIPHGYCLLYLSYYGQQDIYSQDMTLLTGPALDPTIPEPLRSLVTIEVLAANGRSLQQVVEERIAEYPDLTFQQSEATLGGEPAIIVTDLPARDPGRDLFAVHNDQVYHLRVEPLGFPELADELEANWELIIESFHFVHETEQ